MATGHWGVISTTPALWNLEQDCRVEASPYRESSKPIQAIEKEPAGGREEKIHTEKGTISVVSVLGKVGKTSGL